MASRINYQEVLNLYEKGYSNTEIAKCLKRNKHAVGKILKKLNKTPHGSGKEFLQISNLNVLVGTLLGDSSLKYGKALYPCLSFTHSITQKDYFLHKRSQFLYLSTGKFNKSYMGSGFKSIEMLSYNSKYLKCLQDLENIFYINRVKIIPIEFLKNTFTEQSLAYLFMDDGNVNGKSVNLNLQGFDEENLRRFIVFLKEKFDLEWTLQKNRSYLRMYLRYKSINKFVSLVKPYIIDSMLYKLPCSHH